MAGTQFEGSYIEVVGNNPAVGVYLENVDSRVEYRLLMSIVINTPSKLILLIPSDVAEGTDSLKITTHFSNSTKMSVTPRHTVFHQELTVI
jgi:hypothetical protein